MRNRTSLIPLVFLLFSSPVLASPLLTVDINAGYNFVVDSNVESPSSFAPTVATVAAEVCNFGSVPLTDVAAYIGNQSAGTPGIYPARDSSAAAFIAEHPTLANTGSYALTHVGGSLGSLDATRYIGDLGIGECRYQYWQVTYPRRANPNNTGVAVWGASNDPDDDLWLTWDVWAASAEGALGSASQRATMRNEISAFANKIEPSGGLWFIEPTNVQPGQYITSNGVNYDLGNINQGFDNDGDLQPDFNAWLQPVGDGSFDPGCFRLVETSGQVIIRRSGGDPDLILDFQDQLYFTDLPQNNTGGTGIVTYKFLVLNGPCSTALTPYQEVASGADNEKFSGDFGASLPRLTSEPSEITLDKTVDQSSVLAGGTLTYQLAFANTGAAALGLPEYGMPLVVYDSIPTGTSYVAGSAGYSFAFLPSSGAKILFSTNNGVSFSSTEPADPTTVTDLAFWLEDPLPAGGTGSVSFEVQVDSPFVGLPFIENTGSLRFGSGAPFREDETVTLVRGTRSIGDLVYHDQNRSGDFTAGEPGLPNITVELYYDRNGDGLQDSGDIFISATSTSALGAYSFSNLPDGDFLVVVDADDPDLPLGYAATTDVVVAVTGLGTTTASPFNNADFGFAPPIEVGKVLTSSSPATEGALVSYRIDLSNFIIAGGGVPCEFITWGQNETGNQWTNPLNILGAAGPNGTFASATFNGNPHAIVNTWDLLSQSGAGVGNIVKVEALAWIYVNGVFSNDVLNTRISRGGVLVQADVFNAVDLNAFGTTQGDGGLLIWDVTSTGWTWAQWSGVGPEIDLGPNATGASDGVTLFGDAVGFRITTDQSCGAGQAGATVATLPLVDTYDPALLEFVSASVTPTSVIPGTLTWANLAALINNGTALTVSFRALEPPDLDADGEADTASLTNTACTAGGTYADGRPTNSDCGSAVTTLQPRGEIAGTVWNDSGLGGGVNGNGLQDGLEIGIPGVTVELRVGGVLVATTTTDANGDYRFTGLTDATYTVIVLPASLPGATFTQTGDPDATLNHQTTVTLNQNDGNPANDDALGLDFGYLIPNSVFGNLWRDVDGDAVEDAGEEGFAGTTVRLLDCGANAICGDGDDGATRTTTTAANGDYVFSDLPNGNYQVVVDTTTLPAGITWSQTVDPDATLDSRTTGVIAASGGNLYGAYDFAYRPTGSSTIGDLLYLDWDGDGTFDAADDGIANVTVYLYEDQDGDGVVDPEDARVASTVTSAAGAYLFSGLAAGNYTVVVDRGDPDLPGAYSQTDDPDASLDDRSAVAVNGSNSVLTVDFGYQPLGGASLGDLVFSDSDADGIFDSGESGLAGITVSLYEDSNGNGVIDAADALIATTVTDSSGAYLFQDLPAGAYLVDVDSADTNLPVDAAGNRYVLSTAGDPLAVTLGATEAYRDADFGFARGASLADTIWRDDNGDAQQGENELGVANVTVWLYRDVDGDGIYDVGLDTLLATDVTDANGLYEFSGLAAGDYLVVVDTADPDLPSATVTGDPDPTLDGQAAFSVLPGDIIKFADFGFQPPGVIGDQLWIDADADGVFDANLEAGLAGISVRLETPGGVLLATTTTDSEGRYSFGDLADGNYVVVVVAASVPTNLTLAYDPDEGNNCVVCNGRAPVTLAGGARVLTIDFGYREKLIPELLIDKDTSTPTTVAGGQASYTLLVQNAGNAAATLTTVSDTLPAGFTYAATTAIVENLATRTATSAPTVGASSLSWGTWTIDPLGSLRITFTVNVGAAVANGTYDNTAAATYDSDNNGSTDTTVNDDGTQPQDAGTPPTQDPEDDEDVTVASLPVLAIVKSSNGGGSVDPGDVVVYTMTVTNNGTAIASNVRLTDGVPTGTSYVAASAQVSTPVNGATQTYSDNFDPTAAYNGSDGTLDWATAPWAEIGEATNPAAGNVRVVADQSGNAVQISNSTLGGYGVSRLANLAAYRFATLTFNYRRAAFDNASDFVTLEISSTGAAPFTTLATYAGPLNDATFQAASFDISAYRSANTTIRFVSSAGLGTSDFFYVDDVTISAIPRTTTPLAAHAPSALVTAADGYDLYPGESMTVTFSVTVANPAPLGQTTVVNTAFTAADELPEPISDDASDNLNTPNTASIGDLVWDDDDGDGLVGGGESGLANIRLLLYTAGPDNTFGTADDVQVASTFTNASGGYLFVGLAAGNYRVAIDPSSVPAAYDLTTGNEPLDLTLSSNSQAYLTADFGFRRVPMALPVTLASLEAAPGKGGLEITFETATEAGNLGFYLWGRGPAEAKWQRLNRRLIASRSVDSVTPQRYVLGEIDPAISQVFLEDIDLRGRSRWHGPFALDRKHGHRLDLEKVPWAELRRQAAEGRAARQASWRSLLETPLRVEVSENGVQRVTHAQLLAAGIDWSGQNTAVIALSQGGRSVPLRILGRSTWGADSALEFVGEASSSPYESVSVYRLELDPSKASRVGLDDSRPSGLVAATRSAWASSYTENEKAYSFAAPNGDPWYDQWLLANGASLTKTFQVTVDQVAAEAGAQLAISLWGVTNFPESPDHHLIVEVEGLPMVDETFDGLIDHPLLLDLPAGALADGRVDFTLRLPRDLGLPFDLIALDGYGVRYQRRLAAKDGRALFSARGRRIEVDNLGSSDVSIYRVGGKSTEFLVRPSLVKQGASWLASFAGSSEDATYVIADAAGRRQPTLSPARPLLDPRASFGRNVDLLVISHPDFLDGLAPWVAAREAQGLDVEVVDVEAIYAFESGERVDPNGIRSFIRRVAKDFNLSALLLVGGDSYDYRNYLGLGAFSFLPSPYAPTSDLVQFAPVDPLYGDLDDDGIPELAVGRLPVRSRAELDRLLGKILAYDQAPYSGTAIFAADAYDPNIGLSFHDESERFAGLLGPDWQITPADIDGQGLAGARQTLLDGIEGGVALTQYFGHSGPNVWSFQGLFTTTDAAALGNVGLPTVAIQWGCWNTYYVAPTFDTMGHVLLLGEGGAAAVLGAATLTEPESDIALAEKLLARLREPGQTFGQALLQAKKDLAREEPGRIDVLRGWTLLGDPTQKVRP